MTTTERKRKISSFLVLILFLSIVSVSIPGASNAASSEMNWESIDCAKSVNYRDIAQNDKGFYVVVGDGGTIETSTDLNTWKLQTSGTTNYLFGCAWGNGKFVAVGTKGTIMYSDDGTAWNAAKVDSKINFDSIVWGNGKFVAVGSVRDNNGVVDKRIILSSNDGIQWTNSYESQGDSYWRKIVFANNVYFVLGFSDYALSRDGINWIENTIPNDITLNDILWDGNQYVSVGDKSSIYVSKDAMEWKAVKTNINDGLFLLSINQFKNKYIVIIENGSSCSIISSSDLTVWSISSDRDYAEVSKVIVANDKLVAAGWYNTILQTKDGVEWSLREKFTPNLLKVVWNGKQFLTIGNDGTVLFSKDGRNWNSSIIESDNTIVDVVWTGKEYAALSITYDTTPGSNDILKSDVYTSTDGTNWKYSGGINQKNIEKLFYFDNRFFALGRDGQILVSTDAQKWVAAKSNTDYWLRGLTWNGKQFVCVGMFGTVLTSNDGMNWIKRDIKCDADLNDAIWNGKTFAAVGDWKAIARSTDGIKWSYTSSTECLLENVVWDGERFIIPSIIGEVYETKDLKNRKLLSASSLESPLSVAWNGECYVMVGRNGTIAVCVPKNLIKVKINSFAIPFNVAPTYTNGTIMISAKEISGKLGATYSWDYKTKTIKVTKDKTVIVFTIGSKTATVNNKSVKLEGPATIVNGTEMVPTKFIVENLGIKYSWNNNTKTITIIKK